MSHEVERLLELFAALPESEKQLAAAEILRGHAPGELTGTDWHEDELRRRVANANPGASIPLVDLRRELLGDRA